MIRPMCQQDCGPVRSLFEECFKNPWSLRSIEEMIAGPASYNLIAEDEGQVVGYIGILAAADEADITNVAVRPDYRRQHIGTRLLTSLLQLAKEEGINCIYLEVRRSNEAARFLYEKAGFAPVGVRKGYYHNPKEDAVIMKIASPFSEAGAI